MITDFLLSAKINSNDEINQYGLVFKDAWEAMGIGLENTACAQLEKWKSIFQREVNRSKSFRTLAEKIISECKDKPIVIYLAKNASSFVDSAENWTFDVNDLESFIVDPIVDNGSRVGLTQGELMIHILEERYYMGRPGNNYEESHLKCFSNDSYQNQYRRDLGYDSNTLWFELEEHFENPNEDVEAKFYSFGNDGHLTKVDNLKVSKADNPKKYELYSPKLAYYDKANYLQFSDAFISKQLKNIREDVLKFKKFPDRSPIDSVTHFISFRYPENANEMILKELGTILIGNVRLKTWTVLNSKCRMITTESAFIKFFNLDNLLKFTIDTMKDIANKNKVKFPQGWNIVCLNNNEIESEIEKLKLEFEGKVKTKLEKLQNIKDQYDVNQLLVKLVSAMEGHHD